MQTEHEEDAEIFWLLRHLGNDNRGTKLGENSTSRIRRFTVPAYDSESDIDNQSGILASLVYVNGTNIYTDNTNFSEAQYHSFFVLIEDALRLRF